MQKLYLLHDVQENFINTGVYLKSLRLAVLCDVVVSLFYIAYSFHYLAPIYVCVCILL